MRYTRRGKHAARKKGPNKEWVGRKEIRMKPSEGEW